MLIQRKKKYARVLHIFTVTFKAKTIGVMDKFEALNIQTLASMDSNFYLWAVAAHAGSQPPISYVEIALKVTSSK